MKPTLLFVTLSTLLTMPKAAAASELETLRDRCVAQERLIQQLKEENAKLQGFSKSDTTTASVTAKSPESGVTTYTVRAGDSLELIARRNGCSPEAIAESNRLKYASVIHPGQKLKIPVSSAPKPGPSHASPSSSSSGKTHKIQQGETYSSIARKYGITVKSLIACNPQVKPTALRPGQVIALDSATATVPPAPSRTPSVASTSKPAEQKSPAPAPTPARTPEATPAVSDSNPSLAATPTPANEKKIHSVSIEGEMTYGEFAAKYGTDADRLNDLNGLDLGTTTVLAKGSELYVPAQP